MSLPALLARYEVLQATRSELGTEWIRRQWASDHYNRIYFIESGCGFIEHSGNRRELRPGGLHLIPADTPLKFGCDSKIVISWLHFAAPTELGMDITQTMNFTLDVDPEKAAAAVAPLTEIIRTMEDHSPRASFQKLSALLALLSFFAPDADLTMSLRMEGTRRFRKILKLLETQMANPPPVSELAREAGMATASFSRLFKKYFGVSPARYAMRTRLAMAARMIREDRKLHDIAEELGFIDGFHLSKAFKHMTGRCPSSYRAACHLHIP